MIRKIVIAILDLSLLGLFLAVQACSEKAPTGVFDAVTDSTTVGAIEFTTIPAPVSSETGVSIVSTRFSPYLYLGEADGRRALFLLRFTNLPDSITVTEAKLVLRSNAVFGIEGGMLAASVHEITQNWGDTLTYDDIPIFDPPPRGIVTFSTVKTDTVKVDTVNFDASLVNHWIALPDSENYGALIQPESAFAIRQFYSIHVETDSLRPKLLLFHNDTTTQISPIEVVPTSDVFVFKETSPPPDGPLYVGNGIEHKSIIRFDFSTIPNEATITRAKLILEIDQASSFLASENFEFGAELLLKDVTNLDVPLIELIADTAFVRLSSSCMANDMTQICTIDINSRVQSWTTEQVSNFGIALFTRSAIPGRDLYRAAIFSSATDPGRAPKLEIHYTTPPVGKRNDNENIKK